MQRTDFTSTWALINLIFTLEEIRAEWFLTIWTVRLIFKNKKRETEAELFLFNFSVQRCIICHHRSPLRLILSDLSAGWWLEASPLWPRGAPYRQCPTTAGQTSSSQWTPQSLSQVFIDVQKTFVYSLFVFHLRWNLLCSGTSCVVFISDWPSTCTATFLLFNFSFYHTFFFCNWSTWLVWAIAYLHKFVLCKSH